MNPLLLFWHRFFALACIVGPLLAWQLMAQGFFFGGKGARTLDLPTPTAYWGFESNALDYASTNHFQTNGTAVFAAGRSGRAVQLNPNAAWFTLPDNAAISSTGTNWELTGWLNIDLANLGGDWLLGKGHASPGFEYYVKALTNTIAGYSRGPFVGVVTLPRQPITSQSWTWFSLSFDAATGYANFLWQNPGATVANGFQWDATQDGTNALTLGRDPITGIIATFQLDELAWFNGTNLSTSQRLVLFNNGYGRTYTNGIGWR